MAEGTAPVPTTPPSAGQSMTMLTSGGRRVVLQFGEPGVINFIRDDAGNDLLGDNCVDYGENCDDDEVDDSDECEPPPRKSPTKPTKSKSPTKVSTDEHEEETKPIVPRPNPWFDD